MPVPRRSTTTRGSAKKTKTTTRKRTATTPRGRARKGEKLLITCNAIVTSYMMNDLAETLHGSFFYDDDGRYWQVVAVRIDETARKIYGSCQEMYEAAPFMFAPRQ